MRRDPIELLQRLRAIHAAIRDEVVRECERATIEQLSAVVGSEAGDTIFAVDRVSEAVLRNHFAELARDWPCILIAEGLGEGGRVVLPVGTDANHAELRIIVDPIDGTRGLMYQKRPAWILTGVAPNRGEATNLADIELALQTEIPMVKQHLCDSVWVVEGQLGGERMNRLTGETQPLYPHPSGAATIAQGFGNLARFFPGPRALLASIEDSLITRVLGAPPPGRALTFEDQYISSGGQLYELMMGHDRWCADVRSLVWAQHGARGLCCHPYDLCTELIARVAGVRVTDPLGQPLNAPLDVETDMAWIGYANDHIRAQVEPALRAELIRHCLLDEETQA
jgi:hypothetical protein